MADQDQQRAPRSDADLVAAILTGSPGAADELARRHYPAVLAALARQIGDPEEARDLAQDAFLDAFRALGTLRTPRAFPAWLRRISQNRARLLIRQRVAAPLDVPLDAVPAVVSPSLTPKQLLVRRTLAALSPEDRAVLILDGVLGMAGADIAASLGISRAAAYARVARARVRFLARYAEEQNEE
jgi:RNA polymerase sigma-70 factor (ECF subfamily)